MKAENTATNRTSDGVRSGNNVVRPKAENARARVLIIEPRTRAFAATTIDYDQKQTTLVYKHDYARRFVCGERFDAQFIRNFILTQVAQSGKA